MNYTSRCVPHQKCSAGMSQEEEGKGLHRKDGITPSSGITTARLVSRL